MYLTIGLAATCLLAAIVQGAFPIWLGLVVLISLPISMLYRPRTDMRGGVAADASGMMQIQAIISVNLIVAVWLIEAIVRQVFLS